MMQKNNKKIIYFSSNGDGLGDRLIEIIRLESYCDKNNVICHFFWNNKFSRNDRQYPILVQTKRVIPQEKHGGYNPKILLDRKYISGFWVRTNFAKYAQNLRFKFTLDNHQKYISVHIRAADRISKSEDEHRLSKKMLEKIIRKIARMVNDDKNENVFICGDDEKYQKYFIKMLKNKKIIERPKSEIPDEYIDFFMLGHSQKIFTVSKFSAFAAVASVVAKCPLVIGTYKSPIHRLFRLQAKVIFPSKIPNFLHWTAWFFFSLAHHFKIKFLEIFKKFIRIFS